ncbi:hypothetical protein PV08_09827 [Exophiala spinifera]|uniref:Dihydrodipicolinate synthase n=1 Tax=Exophiala spinifera TaxID=91928 RepID=A0A0D2B1R5_9EURO|nr:uncharacterized protein PV08_09827 [Exophiala spinifera]KIW12550.1 hypothetical protein PV08_09827 [Exophiala spinifera]
MTNILPEGIYAPLPAFFDQDDNLGRRVHFELEKRQIAYCEADLKAYIEHALYVTKPGVIPVVSATMGEAAHLDRQERKRLIETVRVALDKNHLYQTPIVAGVGAASTRETIHLAEDAAAAGANFVLVILPSYYANALRATPRAVKQFFVDVASKSPLPVVIYNYPPIAGGIDLSSDDIVDIARTAPNVRGVMLSCGNVGKVSRITSVLDKSFRTFAGFIDFLLPSISVGAAGAISPLPNLAPDLAMEFWRDTQVLYESGSWAKAKKLQEVTSLAESDLLSGGVAGLKYLLSQRFGYPAIPRLPLQPLSDFDAARLSNSNYLKSINTDKK